MRKMRLLAGITLALVLVVSPWTPPPADAFKPFTHVLTGRDALTDAVDDGFVTIDGRPYKVRGAIVAALRAWPDYYNAGVVGPDGFPDLVFGQSYIHPEETGKWLGHLLSSAWEAQRGRGSYSPTERSQILAFTYGYLTHAAGDMWAHTLVNDLSNGVFPSLEEVEQRPERLAIALRHIILEGYIGDATPGYDGNPDRTALPDGDVSDDSSPGIAFNAPKRFIYDTLVDPLRPLPVNTCGDKQNGESELKGGAAGDDVADDGCPGQSPPVGEAEPKRGKLIDHFLDLQANLQITREKLRLDRRHLDIANGHYETRERLVSTVRGRQMASVRVRVCHTVFCLPDAADGADDATLNPLVEAYVSAWIDDIEVGLREWSELGLATTKALFDPQAYRDTQNGLCRFRGGEDNPVRIKCERDVGLLDVVMHKSDPFINRHLLSMLGAPDLVGGVRDKLKQVADLLDAFIEPAANPLRLKLVELEEYAKRLIKQQIKERFGFDVDAAKDFLKHPTHWINVEGVEFNGPSGPVRLKLFDPDDHERLDAVLGLPAGHHVPSDFPFPGASTRLADSAVFDPSAAPPVKNTMTFARLLLLDGGELNRALGDVLASRQHVKDPATVRTYQDGPFVPANIMVDGLLAPGSTPKPWLRSIDSDHAWRADGQPVFCDEGTPGCPPGQAQSRPASANGGKGNFPIWESCLLRPAFRALLTDWESTPRNFPALGDTVSPDPSDPDGPTLHFSATGKVHQSGNVTFVGRQHELRLSAGDSVFHESKLTPAYRLGRGQPSGAWQPVDQSATFSLPANASDGPWQVQYRAGDPCHPSATDDDHGEDLPPETEASRTVELDTTPPAITIAEPVESSRYRDGDTITVGYTAEEAMGSGVASATADLDGRPVGNGSTINAAELDPGRHLVTVTAIDHVGNQATSTAAFRVLPARHCTVRGTPGDDRLVGTPGRDVICGGRGNDHIDGAGGNDILRGGRGNDRLDGGDGIDRCLGGPGRDSIRNCERKRPRIDGVGESRKGGF